MVLFTIIALILILLTVFAIAIISVFGAGSVIVLGDVIVCVFILAWIIKTIIKKKKAKKNKPTE